MNAFTHDWLALREPLDLMARNLKVLRSVTKYIENSKKLKIVDIAGGTGSTVRAMTNHFAQPIEWVVVDHDPDLLEHAKHSLSDFDVTLISADLSKDLDIIFDLEPDLVTTSAFLDLVSKDWVAGFTHRLAETETPFYAALNYDGRKSVEPSHPFDASIIDAFNTHQQTDKGFGNALGPNCCELLIGNLKEKGFEITHGNSDWIADSSFPDFQIQLLTGWYGAALEIRPDDRARIDDWLNQRLGFIDKGQSKLLVGHQDIFAVRR